MTDPQPQETQIELHSARCSCRGGSWVLLGGASGSPCAGASETAGAKVLIGISEWRSLGKPPSAEAYAQAVGRAEKGERREFRRFAATLDVKLGRVPTWRGQPGQTEQTTTEVVAKGGALVRSRMAIEKGETLMFEAGSGFKTRAEVVNISAPKQGATEPWLRLGLRFLDAPLPDSLIPRDAKPVD